MPTYEYACRECEERLEVVQKFTDDALTTCPSCAGSLRKVFSAVGIAFKGSGFYKTDSRGSKSSDSAKGTDSATSDNGKSSDKSDSKAGDSKSGDSAKSEKKSEKSEKKPDAAKPAASSSGSAAAS